MKHASDRERLLAEVLAEAEPTGFREALLGETLRLVGRRRRVRHLQRTGAALVVLGLLGTFAWRSVRPGHAVVARPMASFTDVRTAPLPAAAIVRTQPLAGDLIVRSVASVAVVHTTPNSGHFRNINDEELLALVAPRPAALVRVGPHEEKLIFVNPGDQKDFPVN